MDFLQTRVASNPGLLLPGGCSRARAGAERCRLCPLCPSACFLQLSRALEKRILPPSPPLHHVPGRNRGCRPQAGAGGAGGAGIPRERSLPPSTTSPQARGVAEEQLEQLGVIFQPGWDPALPPPPFPEHGNNSNLHTEEPGALEQLWQRGFRCGRPWSHPGMSLGVGGGCRDGFLRKKRRENQQRFNASLVPLRAGTGRCLTL